MERVTDHLIVISFDCLSSLDFHMLKELPNFKNLLSRSAFCKNVETIYPSVTYPCHTTIVTGNFPNTHGIVNNTLLQPGVLSPDWYWHRKFITGTTLYDEARKAGLITAALLWPVTAKAKIKYNMPEIFANRLWHHQIAVSLWNGSPLYQLEMNRKHGHIRNGLSQPELDDFVVESTVSTIISKKPNLLLVHLTDLDTQRHYHGFSSEEAKAALYRHDQRLGKIIGAIKKAGLEDRATIVALGDHSALDESKAIHPNVLLKEMGLLKVNNKGKVIDWKAYCKSCDGSAYIYIKNQKDKETKEMVVNLFEKLLKETKNGIEQVFTNAHAKEKGADELAFLMIEARQGFYFKECHDTSYIRSITKEDVEERRYTYCSHGYSPAKEKYTTVFIAKGKGIRPDTEIASMHLVDEGPTFATLLGVNLGETDGRSVEEIII
ncbi:ectonucleotide pyrophosphatase/phosphodiesterase [Bacillus weihaiensis]|uniref:Phosphodiesterase n=1 Tax=Bacillus weihaiensis TaxID=1547283 RepID=A0A1L3MRW7_9BACI|nr:ectonucleotide pyrophosphatase/phosphodiesterase [Bacillus weihaiensis]APH05085.1 phosphodiesterase [Bacillus weihaiensis]